MVSVIITFYNRIHWLRDAVLSVLDQSFTDFELLLIDDGSTEDLAPILFDDPRIRLHHQENQGRSAARNTGIRLARGTYIAMLDSDDLFLPEKLERQVAFMECHQADVSHTSHVTFSDDGAPDRYVPAGQFRGWKYPHLLLNCPIATSTLMVRRTVMQRYHYPEHLRLAGEDLVLYFKLAKRYPLMGLDEPLSRYRTHPGNAVGDAAPWLEATIAVMNCDEIRRDPFAAEFRRNILRHVYATPFPGYPDGLSRALPASCTGRQMWNLPAPDHPEAIQQRDAAIDDLHASLAEIGSRLLKTQRSANEIDRGVWDLREALGRHAAELERRANRIQELECIVMGAEATLAEGAAYAASLHVAAESQSQEIANRGARILELETHVARMEAALAEGGAYVTTLTQEHAARLATLEAEIVRRDRRIADLEATEQGRTSRAFYPQGT